MKKMGGGIALFLLFIFAFCDNEKIEPVVKSPDYYIENNDDALSIPLLKEKVIGIKSEEMYKEKSVTGIWQREGTKDIAFWERLIIGKNKSNSNENFRYPEDIAVDSKGNIYVSDRIKNRVQVFNKTGLYIRTIGKEGRGKGEFMKFTDMYVDVFDNLYIADNDNKRIQVFTPAGNFLKEIPVDVKDPRYLTVDSKKNVYVHHVGDKAAVRKYDFEGNKIAAFGEILNAREDIGKKSKTYSQARLAVDKDDNLYVSYRPVYKIDKYSPEGVLLMTFNRGMTDRQKAQKDKFRDDNLNTNRARYIFHISDIFIDHEDRIWITLSDAIDVFSLDGKLLFHKRMNVGTTENIPNASIISKENKAIFLNSSYGTVRVFDLEIKDLKN